MLSYSESSISLPLDLLIQKDKILLCSSVKAPHNVFHMISALGIVNFSLEAKVPFLSQYFKCESSLPFEKIKDKNLEIIFMV